jgi:mannosyl-oligosaccharide alpha-1,3-glucosidase
LPLTIQFFKSGVARVTIDEKRRQLKDIELPEGKNHVRRERYNGAAEAVLIGGKELDMVVNKLVTRDNSTRIRYGSRVDQELIIHHYPFKLEFWRDDKLEMVLNERNLLNVEHWRPKSVKKEQQQEKEGQVEDEQATKVDDEKDSEEEDGMWEESFNGKTDSKPRGAIHSSHTNVGPESIGLDVTFVDYEHVYGIPEHASSFSLKSTTDQGEYSEPYRLYNLDVFEYELDTPTSLYGAIPFMYAHRKTPKGSSDAALLWLNAAETWIDISKSNNNKNPLSFTTNPKSSQTHWISESGILDVIIFLGPDSKSIFKQYGEMTGTTPLPPLFSIGHHQCRWNYMNEEDVLSVDSGFDEREMPYDTIWLDIEYTDDKQYFTWNSQNFPNPEAMLDKLDMNKRKLVAIIDPHIKRKEGYWVHKEGEKQGHMVKNSEGGIFDGWCWPGSSSWVDFTSQKAREWWSTLFKFDKFKVHSLPCLRVLM